MTLVGSPLKQQQLIQKETQFVEKIRNCLLARLGYFKILFGTYLHKAENQVIVFFSWIFAGLVQ